MPYSLCNNKKAVAVSTPVPVANRTLAYRSLESGLRPHDIKIDGREPFAAHSFHLLSISHFSKLGDDLLAGLCFFCLF